MKKSESWLRVSIQPDIEVGIGDTEAGASPFFTSSVQSIPLHPTDCTFLLVRVALNACSPTF